MLATPPDHGLVTARVGPDAAARRVEDHHGVGVIEGVPSGLLTGLRLAVPSR